MHYLISETVLDVWPTLAAPAWFMLFLVRREARRLQALSPLIVISFYIVPPLRRRAANIENCFMKLM